MEEEGIHLDLSDSFFYMSAVSAIYPAGFIWYIEGAEICACGGAWSIMYLALWPCQSGGGVSDSGRKHGGRITPISDRPLS